MAASDAPSDAGGGSTPDPEVTFASRDATSGNTDLAVPVFLRCAWRHSDRSFDVTVVTSGSAPSDPPTCWQASNLRQPPNVSYDNWYARALGACASLDAKDRFQFAFVPAETADASAVPAVARRILSEDEDAETRRNARTTTATLRWTWYERKETDAEKGTSMERASARDDDDDDDDDDDVRSKKEIVDDLPARLDDARGRGARRACSVVLERVFGMDFTGEDAHCAIALAEALRGMYGESVSRNESLRVSVRRLRRDARELRAAADFANRELARFFESKQTDEHFVVAKVASMLNEKKKKIRALELDLEAARHQVDSLEKSLAENDSGTFRRGGVARAAAPDEAARDARRAERRDARKPVLAKRRARAVLGEASEDKRAGEGEKRRVSVESRNPSGDADVVLDGEGDVFGAFMSQALPFVSVALTETQPAGTQGTQGTQRSTHRRQTQKKPGRRRIGDDIGDDLNIF